MKTKKTRLVLCMILVALMLFTLTACGQDGGGKDEQTGEVLLPISVNGKEIRVGETKLQTLLDAGLDVSWVDESFNRITVDPDMELEANAYYTGGSIKMSDRMSFSVSLATEDEPVPLGQAVIARMELHMAAEDDKSVLEKISFDGIPVTEWTQAKAVEKYPDWTGNEVMWLTYGLEYSYTLTFDMATGNLNGFTVECKYDVDWNS